LFVAMLGSTGKRGRRFSGEFAAPLRHVECLLKLKEKNMSFSSPSALGKLVMFAVTAIAFSACGGGGVQTQPLPGATPPPTTYSFTSKINPPNTLSFDISFVDETEHLYTLSDRSTNGIDVVNTQTNAFLGTAGAGAFQGLGTTVAGFSRNPNAGPNGNVSLGNGLVAAGDGNSTLKIVNVSSISSSVVASIPVPNPYTGPNLPPNICQGTTGATTGTPTVGAGNFRVDEMAYDPSDNVIAAMSDNACPAFITFFQGTAPYSILGAVALTTANAGAEQTVWDPAEGLFVSNIPGTTTNPGGELDRFSPKTFKLVSVTPMPVPCGGSGLALGQNETAVSACGGNTLAGTVLGGSGHMLTLNIVTGAMLNDVVGPSPDEVWYAPQTNRFYGADTAGGTLAVLDGTGNLLSRVATSSGAHSVAVEGLYDHVFVPQSTGSNIGITIYDH
jgi:hypothetical protein